MQFILTTRTALRLSETLCTVSFLANKVEHNFMGHSLGSKCVS